MREFKFHTYVHLFNLFSILLPLFLYALIRGFMKHSKFDAVLLLFSLIAVFNLIKYLGSYYVVNNCCLVKKSLFKKQELKWDEIEHIDILPSSKGSRYVLGIYGQGKEILVSYWVSSYRDLMRLVMENCNSKGNSRLKVDPVVIEFIKG